MDTFRLGSLGEMSGEMKIQIRVTTDAPFSALPMSNGKILLTGFALPKMRYMTEIMGSGERNGDFRLRSSILHHCWRILHFRIVREEQEMKTPEIEHDIKSVIFAIIRKWEGLEAALRWAGLFRPVEPVSDERIEELLAYFDEVTK